ncbi:PHD finger and BAH domain-containing protein, variant [Blastomyces dermatitidis ATCC 18188]|uniref:PHD finger and BAH domain-containing protein n=1 Tax=Ajellomyces dermatitidis (strain ATCC 18188 / CBS 674.68) TaxID=653446 RepID=F2TJB2_AJEDA|nr:PHD finger and BAH domain-containing protein [Blastomyces dermatitidis ATCC 18188]EQL27870.1 hypothetical protein BDFG_09328 [Blastomyces dermatitidis ATCC 26199]KMW68080.1 PHD finger and BAH domain-containing protein, variant [Blastomyces dermatitidis ATCC 18188]
MSSSQSAAATPDRNRSPSTKASDQLSTENASSRNGIVDSTAPKSNPVVNGLQSQPMTATTSSASSPTSDTVPQNVTTPSATGAVPYGTRSRNRVGGARPNYAEDRDIDADYELVASMSRSGGSKRASNANHGATSPSTDNDKATGISTRRQATTNNSSSSAPQTKEPIPGTSSFSANLSSNSSTASKKRKQPGSHQSTPASSTPNTISLSSTKKFIAPANISPEYQKAHGQNMLTFNNCKAYLHQGKLKADDGTILSLNDHVYLVCEPPGEPYYLARIMEFLPSKDNPDGPIESIRVNWYYRPRDIHRNVSDPRVVFASMHSDTCPLSSLRGKCHIKHQSEITNMDDYRKSKDCFWFEKMYDRYIQRYYDVIPTSKVINVPQHVKKVLDERWKYVLVEVGRRKDLTSAVKTCKKCSLYAANTDSVDCAVCHSTYHMYCVRPVLQKKPARGFAWACAACSRAQERKLEARNTPIIGEVSAETEVEPCEEEEEDPTALAEATQRSTPALPDVVRPATSEQIAQAKLWPFRYLGIHCRVEDALDYDDRIYPRASSRIGPRHQANVIPWYGHPVQYVKAPEPKKRNVKSANKKDLKLSREAVAAMEAEKAERAKRPKWVQDEPVGYIPRGEDAPVTVNGKQIRTAELLVKMPDASQLPSRGEDDAPGSSISDADREKFIDEYMAKAKEIAPSLKVERYSTNFLDKALELLYAENFNVQAALTRLKQVNKYADLKEPHLRPEEVKAFESGVALYGSELRNVTKHVGTVPHRHIVRYYYMWKKTPKGRQIWGNFDGRRGRKAAKQADSAVKLVDDVADDYDDSAFDNDKAKDKKRGFTCKFCSTRSSRQWRRAPGTPPGTAVSTDPKRDKAVQSLTVAICQRCATLWRKYGIQWEDADEVVKKIGQGGNKSWRRRYEEELLIQLLTSSETDVKINSTTATIATSLGISLTAEVVAPPPPSEPPKKKVKSSDQNGSAPGTSTPAEPAPAPRKKVVDKPAEPPPIAPEPPRVKTLPCAVCDKMDPMGDQHLSCRDCRLTVHRACYGVSPSWNSSKWFCDMCSNDRNPAISTSYECVLCPVTYTEHELMEPPKVSHKKKTDREREKERLEKEMVAEASKLYKIRQKEAGKPTGPREPLKRTAGNNWVHVTCAVWVPEIKFGNAKELEPAEGFGLIPAERFQDNCKICKTRHGACVSCHNTTCNARFHVGCARQAGYTFGFDITPVKSTRRDTVNTMKLGDEVGAATPAIWCPQHPISTIVHEMSEPSEVEGLNALQLYCRTSKQADLTLTGTVRKAAHVQQSVGVSIQNGFHPPNRRVSVNGTTPHHNSKDNSHVASRLSTEPIHGSSSTGLVNGDAVNSDHNKKCFNCNSTFSPKWWTVESSLEFSAARGENRLMMNGVAPKDGPGSAYSHATPTASSPFQAPSGHVEKLPPIPMINGDVLMVDADRQIPSTQDAPRSFPRPRALHECHKCHVRKQSISPVESEVRPSPYSAKRDPSLPAARISEFPHHQYSPSPHAHPTPHPPTLPMPPIVQMHSHGTPDWRPEYEQRPGDYGPQLMRNGMPPGGPPPSGLQPLGPRNFHAGPPPQPPQHLNGYHPSLPPHHQGHPHAPPPQQHYGNGVPPPPPHSYSAHQSPYGPVPLPPPNVHGPPQPHQPTPPPPSNRPYNAAAPNNTTSPAPHFSPPHTLNTLPPNSRMFSVDRPIAPGHQSPSSTRHSLDSPRPATPAAGDENISPSANGSARPSSSGRFHNTNVPTSGAGSGASASPSLKNLLS